MVKTIFVDKEGGARTDQMTNKKKRPWTTKKIGEERRRDGGKISPPQQTILGPAYVGSRGLLGESIENDVWAQDHFCEHPCMLILGEHYMWSCA